MIDDNELLDIELRNPGNGDVARLLKALRAAHPLALQRVRVSGDWFASQEVSRYRDHAH
jgi:hypothetical protein